MNRVDRGTFKTAIKQDAVLVETKALKAYIGAVLELGAVLNGYGELNPGWDEIRRISNKIDRKCGALNSSIVELARRSSHTDQEQDE